MRIDFLVADNPYATTTHFSEKFAAALRRLGVETRLFPIGGGNFFKAFYAVLADPPDLTCSFSDITLGIKQPLGAAWGINHLSFFIDHAVYFLHQLQGDYSVVSTIDEEDLAFIQSLSFKRAFFLPHGVDKELFSKSPQEPLYEVVMLASCIDYEAIRKRWKKKYPKHVLLLETALERIWEERVSVLRALVDLGVQEELPLLHQELESYVRGEERVGLLRELKGVSLHIWGQGKWKKYLPEAVIHHPVSFGKALQVMGRARLVLNSIPSLRYGSHERIFHAFACGALPFTSETPYISSHFEEGKTMVTYRRGKWEEMRAKVGDLLHNESKRKEIVEAGREVVLKHHTWDERGKTLLDFLQQKVMQER